MATFEQALAEAYASAPTDVVTFDTLEVRHSAFRDDAGHPMAIRIVIGYEDISARLEGDAPLHAGQYVDFIAGAFRFKLPGFEEGRVPQLQITIDGVNREVVGHIEAAINEPEPIYITYRPYLSSDLSKPQMNPPITMELSRVTVTGASVSGTASLSNVHNWAFPFEKYTAKRFPGLVR
ncbi:DUF1833 family protein [Alcaligenes endophyticus]|uniref:DUF1833 domain-containing protein n=1 Tax=Alcaligenes endophyticus TaxID=1929088 RepID=A0ABT8EKA1_9BURK|nr:DUF1833 family protein [Alcaligenes endophyticus]MCX5592020.1 DUF1833 family protein [Alcaligenes endophyticus]MDN4121710.1 DUF1833 domain-containing protein [Alcaligenes endophyticus]